MKLKVLGSGSSGNCYILESNSEALIIEAGLPFMEVKKALNFDVRKIAGVLVSHIHKDHAAAVDDFVKAGIHAFKPYGCDLNRQFRIYGRFTVDAFALKHDVPCFGFLISHPDIGKMVYVSDTQYCKYKFKNVNHILVEANYLLEYLPENEAKREHVLAGHMSIDTAERFVVNNSNSALQNVVLIHLSKGSANPRMFKQRIQGIVKDDVNVEIATKGLEIDLNTVPF